MRVAGCPLEGKQLRLDRSVPMPTQFPDSSRTVPGQFPIVKTQCFGGFEQKTEKFRFHI